jgi:O-antigen ligase
LTGRTFLWQLIAEQIQRHPWLGAGYGGFWVYNGKAYDSVISQLDWGPPSQAHNGYLDILNDIGIIGFAIFATLIVNHVRNLYRLHVLQRDDIVFFHAALIFAAILINFAESSFLRYTDFWWILVCISIIEVHVQLRRVQLAASPRVQS